MDNWMELLFFGIFCLVIGNFVYSIAKYGSFKGALFGSSIKNTVGEVAGKGPRLMKMVIKVHELDDESQERVVGLEVVTKTFSSYRMTPFAMNMEEAKKLAELINSITYGK